MTQEEIRLSESGVAPEALETVGALSQRTCVGHRARRLQPVRERLGIFVS